MNLSATCPGKRACHSQARKASAGGKKSCIQPCLEEECSLRAPDLHSGLPRKIGEEEGRSHQRQVAQAHRRKGGKKTALTRALYLNRELTDHQKGKAGVLLGPGAHCLTALDRGLYRWNRKAQSHSLGHGITGGLASIDPTLCTP